SPGAPSRDAAPIRCTCPGSVHERGRASRSNGQHSRKFMAASSQLAGSSVRQPNCRQSATGVSPHDDGRHGAGRQQTEIEMDWIESWFGLNPDGGSGTVEAGIIMAAVLAIGAGVLMFTPRMRASVLETLRGWLRLGSARPPR